MPYIGNTIRAADDYRLIDDISSSFNGSTTSFALQVAGSAPVPFPKSPQQVLISVNGVIQEPDPTGASGFNLVGTNIVFSSAPTNGHAFFGIIYATADYLNAGGTNPAGSVGAPSITFIGDEDTGLYRKGSGSIGFVSDATEIANTDSNGITISSGNLILGDSAGASSDRVVLGASSDLSIYHNGTNSIIDNNTNDLIIRSDGDDLKLLAEDDIVLRDNDDSTNFIHCINGGSVELFHNGNKKAETVSGGFTVTGTLTATTLAGNIDAVDGDFDGTLEADAITVGGVALNTVIAGVTVTNATNATNAANITAADESSDTTCFPVFVTAATGNLAPKTGSNLSFNSSSGLLTATAFAGDGSGLTGVTSTTINTNADNRVITGSGTANTLNGESQLTYDDSTNILKVASASSTSTDKNLLHVVGGGTADRGLIIGTGRSTGASQNHAMCFYDAINEESNEYGSQHIFRRGGHNNMVIGYQSNNYVGINNDFPGYELSVKATDTNESTIQILAGGNGKESNLLFGAPDDADVGAIKYDHNGDHMKFLTGGSERFRVNANGICIGGTGSANGLNDYEEGSWTPTLTNTGTNASVNYTIQHGRYTKIGNVVYLFCFMDIAAGGITAAGTGDSTISGLPFATSNDPTSSDCHGSASDNMKSISNNFSAQRNNAMLFFAHASSIIAIHQYSTINPIYQTGWGSGQVANGDRFKWAWTARYRTDS